MDRTLHFIAGFPRSGSTLLCNLLAQNPRFHSTSTSGIYAVMREVRGRWKKLYGENRPQSKVALGRVLGSMLAAYHDDPEISAEVVFDKNRAWMGQLDTAELALGRKAKVLVSVRDVRDVIASFEKLWRKESATWHFSQESGHKAQWQSIEGRCEVWMDPKILVGSACRGLRKALENGYRDRLCFVPFEDLTTRPRETLQRVYAFLEEPWFEHDFENVEQVTWEDDLMHGIPGLHNIRTRIEPMPPQWPRYLGEAANRYVACNELWQQPDKFAKKKG